MSKRSSQDKTEGTMDKLTGRAKELARRKPSSQLLVYKQDGMVQTEQTYG